MRRTFGTKSVKAIHDAICRHFEIPTTVDEAIRYVFPHSKKWAFKFSGKRSTSGLPLSFVAGWSDFESKAESAKVEK